MVNLLVDKTVNSSRSPVVKPSTIFKIISIDLRRGWRLKIKKARLELTKRAFKKKNSATTFSHTPSHADKKVQSQPIAALLNV